MPVNTSEGQLSIFKLILIPSVITLAVTVLRLVGELQGWNETLFNPAPGGGGAPIGITWLVPIFGIYFALKLVNSGAGPARLGPVFLYFLLGIAAIVVPSVLAVYVLKWEPGSVGLIVVSIIGCVVAILIMKKPWPELFKTLLAYGYAARIPVAILMFIAIRGNWGTHYDVPPPNFPQMSWLMKWVIIGALPQLIIWIAFTVLVGSLFGGIAAAFKKKPQHHASATSA